MWPKFPDICFTVEGKSRKKPQPGADSTGDRTQACCVTGNDVTPGPQHSGEKIQITHEDITERTPLRNKLHNFKGFQENPRRKTEYFGLIKGERNTRKERES